MGVLSRIGDVARYGKSGRFPPIYKKRCMGLYRPAEISFLRPSIGLLLEFPLRILIADDHQGVRSEIRSVLEAQRWSVCGEAENGPDALDKVRQLKPDVVILDLSMPLMNGYEVARAIRQTAPFTRILILSMYDPANLPSAITETDADAFVTKSRAVHDLISTIKHLS